MSENFALSKLKTQRSKIENASVIVLVLLLVLGFGFPLVNQEPGIVNAQATSTVPSDMLQYEWNWTGVSHDGRFSAGPAPDKPNLLWSWNPPDFGFHEYGQAVSFGVTALNGMAAFNGMLFVGGNTITYAVNPETGDIIWQVNVTGSIMKYDDTHMLLGTNCLETSTGKILWTAENGFAVSPNVNIETGYDPVDHIYATFSGVLGTQSGTVYAWNLTDISQPPTLIWQRLVDNVGTSLQYGGGMFFPASYWAHQMALNATTGETIWDTQLQGEAPYSGVYYQGNFYRGGLDNTMYCFDGATGEILWKFNPGTFYGFWCCIPGAAYGCIYEMNTDTYLYCLNATTGAVVWKYKGPGNFYPGNPVIGDGKIYMETGNTFYRDFATGAPGSPEYACLNATTGEPIWKLPVEVRDPMTQALIAYGNLYLTATVFPGSPMPSYPKSGVDQLSWYGTPVWSEVWCISDSGTPLAGQDWPMFRGGPTQPSQGLMGPTNLAVKWTFTTGGAVISSPSAVNGVIYVGSQDKNIYALNAATGTEIWSFQTGYSVRSSPAVVDGKVYTGADDGNIYCLDASTGQQVWKTSAGGITQVAMGITTPVVSSPEVVNGKLYVGSFDNNTYCLDADSGSVLWKFQTPGPVFATPSIVDNVVYITSEGSVNMVYAINADTGTQIWQKELTAPTQLDIGMFSSPTVADGVLYIGVKGFANAAPDYYFALNATTGEVIWQYQCTDNGTPIPGSVLYVDGMIYFPDYFNLVCVNATNGEPVWKTWLSRQISTSPSYAAGKIYVTDDYGAVIVLDSINGTKISTYYNGVQWWSSPTLYNDYLYIGCLDNNLYCFEDSVVGTTYYGTSVSAATVASASPLALAAFSPSTVSSTETYIVVVSVVVIIMVVAAVVLLRRRRIR